MAILTGPRSRKPHLVLATREIQVNERLSFSALKLGLRFVLPKEDKGSKRGKRSVLGT